ncbi:HalOD1 output domain-containing protein [Natrinema sp. SYSU A 869]|uniref:HalOD1 output domain-containing protein n=1 Tax=Natrinema sp. SYSU A 869 TaxID=2871694 RepID=UPI001CA3BC3A|nr:HalOD1 output domain-containing protein [Natrinema sp. SYSU A 869]
MNSLESISVSVAADDQLSMAIIDLVAQTSDTDPVELQPLYDVIDPDLLDSLPGETGFTGLEFSYQGYTVTVADASEGIEVTLEETGRSADGSTNGLIDSSL